MTNRLETHVASNEFAYTVETSSETEQGSKLLDNVQYAGVRIRNNTQRATSVATPDTGVTLDHHVSSSG